MKEGFLEVTGGKVWYIIHNETAEGTPLLVLHGGMQVLALTLYKG